MPINKVGLVRTDGVHNAAAPAAPFVPLYSVLFWYGDDKNFINTPSGNLNFNYYRSYQELYNPLATYYKSDGSLAPQAKSNPLISCVNADFNWTTTTGVNITASTDMPSTGATLFNPVSHGSAVITRSKIYNVLASTPGQATTPTFSYISQAGTNTHTHSVVSIANSLTNLSFGDPTPDGTSYNGINAINVKPILRDPRMYVDSGDVYNDTKLYCLPKDIVVFGNNLPTNNYTRSDTTHTYSATGQILPLIATANNIGTLNIANTLSFTVTSNTVLNHNHNLFPYTKQFNSKTFNQVGYNLVPAGAHSHQVTYTSNVSIRSKILKAWVTTKDATPIANGVIIGYSIGTSSLYQDQYSNSQGLPVNWHFCDGTKGTPDLRGYFIYANFNSSNNCHDTVYNSSNTLTINSITVAANGNHSHVGPLTGTTPGTGAPTDIGEHSYEDVLNHVHTISNANTFLLNTTDTSNTINITAGQTYNYVPPQTQLAFIMYNNTIT